VNGTDPSGMVLLLASEEAQNTKIWAQRASSAFQTLRSASASLANSTGRLVFASARVLSVAARTTWQVSEATDAAMQGLAKFFKIPVIGL
jgi:hypothetical protein